MKLDILHVLSDTGVGGAGIFLRNLISASDSDVFSHSVILPRGALVLADILKRAGARVTLGSFRGERSLSLGMLGAAAHAIRVCRPDILHTHGAFSAALSPSLTLTSIPVLTTLHCAVPYRGSRLAGRLSRRFWTATSDEAARVLRSRGIPDGRIRKIKNGSLRSLPPSDAERSAARYALGLSPNDFAVGISARLEPIKDHGTAIFAVRELVSRGEGATLVIIGDGSRRGELSALTEELGIKSHVIFTGFIQDTRSVYSALDAHLNCSLGSETSCLAVSETMAMGIPQAVSDCAGNLELVGGGRGALVFPKGDPLALAACLGSLMRDEALRRRYSDAARELFEKELTAERMAREYERYYIELCKPSAR